MLEVTCTTTTCRSVVDLTGWGQPGEWFRHVMLTTELDDPTDVAKARCPACGGVADVQRAVPDKAKIALGQIVATHDAAALIAEHHSDAAGWTAMLLMDHQAGDWGDLDEEDEEANEAAIGSEAEPENRSRILGVHPVGPALTDPKEDRIWIITEAGRQNTTILLPGEY